MCVDETPLDCLIVGAGPAGLTAAIYLARFRRNVLVANGGASRALLIPVSHNYPGFPSGITGEQLLARLHEQAVQQGATIINGEITALEKHNSLFIFSLEGKFFSAKKVLLATGISDRHWDTSIWQEGVRSGKIRLCPICDGHEALDHSIALISTLDTAVTHALFLRTYTSRLTLFCSPSAENLSPTQRETLHDAGVKISTTVISDITLENGNPMLVTPTGETQPFDYVYVMLGDAKSAHLALSLDAQCDDNQKLLVDFHQRTNVEGLYAAGDLVSNLNQINVATAQGAIAATDIHNTLERNFR